MTKTLHLYQGQHKVDSTASETLTQSLHYMYILLDLGVLGTCLIRTFPIGQELELVIFVCNKV